MSKRILVFDDYVDGAEMVAILLERRGWSSEIVADVTQLLQLLEVSLPDAVIIDLAMPEIDGYEVARELRRRYASGLRLVALTGLNTEAARDMARWAGFDDFLVKPFRLDDADRVFAD